MLEGHSMQAMHKHKQANGRRMQVRVSTGCLGATQAQGGQEKFTGMTYWIFSAGFPINCLWEFGWEGPK